MNKPVTIPSIYTESSMVLTIRKPQAVPHPHKSDSSLVVTIEQIGMSTHGSVVLNRDELLKALNAVPAPVVLPTGLGAVIAGKPDSRDGGVTYYVRTSPNEWRGTTYRTTHTDADIREILELGGEILIDGIEVTR